MAGVAAALDEVVPREGRGVVVLGTDAASNIRGDDDMTGGSEVALHY